jgi:hypothetical protein
VIGDWVAARTDEGLLDVEYALFDASEVLLAAPLPMGLGLREQGYLTTASIAHDRLVAGGVTEELAARALKALGPLDPLARTAAVARVASQLVVAEAFQGSLLSRTKQRYAGMWLDLDAVAAGCDGDEVARWMQLVHLMAVLAEMPDDTPVRLISDAEQTKANQRTWRRIDFSNVVALPNALGAMRRPTATRVTNEAQFDEAVLADLRARAALSKQRPRLHALASALTKKPASNPPPSPPPDLIVTDHPGYEPVPLLDELRSHTELLHGEKHVREVARFLTAMASGEKPPSELAILAARAWLASGEVGYARYFSRRVTEDTNASVGARIAAVEILESTSKTNESMRPPPVQSIVPNPVLVVGDPEPIPPPPRAPAPEPPPPAQVAAAPAPPPPQTIEPLKERPRTEVVETMSTPEGNDVRVRMTQLARELARDYRLAYGTTLKTDPIAIEAMQRHLRRRLGDAKTEERRRGLEAELLRHGALLSEILARSLGAQWIETSGEQPGTWSMLVPPATRVWPIGRVYRFFEQGHRESDLVAFYFELERAARPR